MNAQTRESGENALVVMKGVAKSYGGVVALRDVDLRLFQHSIHAVLGENGAGKSTLIKILTGVVSPDVGTIAINGDVVVFGSPRDATAHNIACVFQELSLIPDLTVADNIFIDRGSPVFGFFSRRAQRREAERVLAELACEDIDPLSPVRALSLSQMQMVEIGKAMARGPRLLILDEATSALTENHVARLFDVLRQRRDRGCGIVYISHRMHEIDTIADTCSVFRNGRRIDTFPQGSKSPDDVVEMMIGRSITQVYPAKPPLKPSSERAPPPRLEVRDLGWEGKISGVSFAVRPGEIYGFGGIEGQGQIETLMALFGVLRGVHGEVRVDGKAVDIRTPRRAKREGLGIAFVPTDRKTEGLHLTLPIRHNIALTVLAPLSRFGFIAPRRERALVAELTGRLRVKAAAMDGAVGTLSGGNQQKVVLAKWLATHPRIILLADPTRGIDVGTKTEIYALLRHLATEGATVVLYTTDYDELIGLCDRVGIFYAGRVRAELAGRGITEKAIMNASFGLNSLAGEAGT